MAPHELTWGAAPDQGDADAAAIQLGNAGSELDAYYAFDPNGKPRKRRAQRSAVSGALEWSTFFEEDDAKLAWIADEYTSGRMLSGEIKGELVKVLAPIVDRHQRARALVTDDVVRAFMTPRKLAGVE